MPNVRALGDAMAEHWEIFQSPADATEKAEDEIDMFTRCLLPPVVDRPVDGVATAQIHPNDRSKETTVYHQDAKAVYLYPHWRPQYAHHDILRSPLGTSIKLARLHVWLGMFDGTASMFTELMLNSVVGTGVGSAIFKPAGAREDTGHELASYKLEPDHSAVSHRVLSHNHTFGPPPRSRKPTSTTQLWKATIVNLAGLAMLPGIVAAPLPTRVSPDLPPDGSEGLPSTLIYGWLLYAGQMASSPVPVLATILAIMNTWFITSSNIPHPPRFIGESSCFFSGLGWIVAVTDPDYIHLRDSLLSACLVALSDHISRNCTVLVNRRRYLRMIAGFGGIAVAVCALLCNMNLPAIIACLAFWVSVPACLLPLVMDIA